MLFKRIFGLPKREKVWIQSISNYLEESDVKVLNRLLKRDKITVGFERVPLSFLIAGNNLLPVVKSGENAQDFNVKLREKYFDDVEKEFSSRAFDVLPHFVASEKMGLFAEKRIAVALLFSNRLRVLFASNEETIINFLKMYDWVVVDDVGTMKYFPMSSCLYYQTDDLQVDCENFDFVYTPKDSVISDKLVFESSEERIATRDFLKTYAEKARWLSVNVPKELSLAIDNFVAVQGGSPRFSNAVKELAKSIARSEFRSKLIYKDILRAFEIAQQSVKK